MCVNDNMYFDRYYVYIQYMPSPIHVHVNVCSIVYICKYCVCPYGPYVLLDIEENNCHDIAVCQTYSFYVCHKALIFSHSHFVGVIDPLSDKVFSFMSVCIDIIACHIIYDA